MKDAQNDAEEALKLNPNDVNAHRMLARVYTRQIGDQQNHIDEAMLHKASAEFQKITELDPTDVDSLLMLGRLRGIEHKPAEAEQSYRKALAIDAENEEALVGLATVLTDAGNNTEAADILKKLAEKNPSHDSLTRLAAFYEQMKEYGLAAETLKRALAANPPDAIDLQRAIADYQRRARNYKDAIKTYEEIVKADPKDASSYLDMSRIYLEMRNFAMARQMEDKAKSAQPDNIEIRFQEVEVLQAEAKYTDAIAVLKDILPATAHRNYNAAQRDVRKTLLGRLAFLQERTDQTEGAVDTFKQMENLDPDSAPLMEAEIVNAYQQAKDFVKAEQAADSALKKYPDDRAVRATHASVLADMNKTDAGAAEMKKLLGTKEDFSTYLSIAQIYDKGKKYDDATKALDQAEKLAESKDDKETVWIQRASMLDKEKKHDASEAEYRKVLAESPDNAGALNDLGYMLADRNVHLNEALTMITKAIELDPNNGAYLDSLGWVYFRLGRLNEAEENLRKALSFTPRDATVHDHMGEVLMKQSKLKDAVAQWEISLKEWNASSPADLDQSEIAKVKNKLDGAKVRLAREGSRP
jgi:tetratricopeptide (TPR) repeat protein